MRTEVQEAIEAAIEARWFASARLDAADRSAADESENTAALLAALRAQLCLSEALMRLCWVLADQVTPNFRVDAAPRARCLN